MLAPEVWSLKTKETQSSIYASEFKLYKKDSIDQLISSNNFNHNVAFTIAGDAEISDDLIRTVEKDNEYYLISDITVYEFFDSVFINSFIKKGKLSVLSTEHDIYSTNSFAITPNGSLVLRLLEESFSCLGIEGKQTKIWGNNHYVITLDLNKKELTSGKLYDRYRKFFSNSDLRFDVIAIWEPPDSSICPSSVASYFCNKSFKVSLCSPKHTVVKQFEESIPSPFQSEPEDFLHWFGVHLIEANGQQKSAQSSKKTNVVSHKWTGFFSSTQVLNLWKHLQRSKEEISDVCWSSLYLSCFQNSPLNFSSQSKMDTNSDEFVVIFCSNDKCIVFPSKPIRKDG